MALSKNLQSYSDCEVHFEAALEAENYIKLTFETKAITTRYHQRLNNYRVLLRERSRGIFPPHSPQYDTSPYDNLVVSRPKDEPCALYIRKANLTPISMEKA